MANLIWLALLPVLLGVAELVTADLPLDKSVEIPTYRDTEGNTIYRLPESLDPIHSEIEITPYFVATETREAFTFDGVVTIVFNAVEDGITELTFHENVLQILGVTLSDSEGSPIPLNTALPFERQREYHFLKVYLHDGLTLTNGQNYTIKVTYLGFMNETPLSRGMFRGSYVGTDGTKHWYAATHLQPTHTRQLAPSFDEPGFKCTFDIIVNRPSNYGQTYSNMKIAQEINNGDRVKEIFYTTPRMSGYLITIHISEAFTVIADNNDNDRSYRILARPNAVGQGDYALEVGPPLTTWLENYLGVPYYSMGEDMKNDQIAVPDWASGATENWGLVSYRELRLLYEEGETNFLDKMYVATITAHELGHKWFGNLVTCRWWDNVWINEGYASYFEYFAMDAVDPSMELEDQFNIMYVQNALSTDSAAATRALQHEVNTPTEVTGHFTGISYSKGASLLMMLRHWLSDDTFRKALNYYLVEMAYEHAYPEDVFRNFERAVTEDSALTNYPGVDILEFLRYWVYEPGYPVLNVDVNVDTGVMSLSQERFFVSATATPTEQVWPLPLTYTTQSNPNWENRQASHVMNSSTYQITKAAGDEWVIFNIKQNGIYRVNYNTHNWLLIANALKENPSSIHYLNRAQIVDDVFALMRSGRLTYEIGFQVLDFLKSETSYYVWYPAITGFSWLRNRFLHLPEALAEFETVLNTFVETVVEDLGYDVVTGEAYTTTLHRFFTLTFACIIGHQGCREDAISKYNNLVSSGVSVDPNLRRHVFCNGVNNGDYAEWNFLHQRRLNGNNQADSVVMLRAMGCTTNQQAIDQYLEIVMDDDIVKAQDRVNAYTFLFMGDRGNARAAIPFFKEHYDEIRTGLITSGNFAGVLSTMAAYMDEEGLVEFEEWLTEVQSVMPEATTGLAGIASARTSMEWGTNMADEILAAARGSAYVFAPTIMTIVIAVVTVFMQ